MQDRKKDHIEMALDSAAPIGSKDSRFYYEPMLSAHPGDEDLPLDFLGKKLHFPFWVSSMTGGTREAHHINRNLARMCGEFGFGMGLGSCRSLLRDDSHFADFDLRSLIGDGLPFYANLGIAQVEQLIGSGSMDEADRLVTRLGADGLIIHVNPLQEWLQPEGDRIEQSPLITVRKVVERAAYPVIVKEVGQGMGPESLSALLELPLAAIEFGAYGGTNFSRLEIERGGEAQHAAFSDVGHTAGEMMGFVQQHFDSKGSVAAGGLIISGGIASVTDGYALLAASPLPAVIGQASAFLRHARGDYEELRTFALTQIEALRMASAYLRTRK